MTRTTVAILPVHGVAVPNVYVHACTVVLTRFLSLHVPVHSKHYFPDTMVKGINCIETMRKYKAMPTRTTFVIQCFDFSSMLHCCSLSL